MPDNIFLIGPDGKLTTLSETGFVNEEVFQELLAIHPELLNAGEHERGDKRWLLIKREMEIPDTEVASGRWSLDHLFVDTEGIPTLIEVKRSSDTRIRREVVGQMLDYAANSVLYWGSDLLLQEFEKQCAAKHAEPSGILSEFLQISDTETDRIDEFWRTVSTNLEAERIRLIFVADEIPRELQRIVEFLNGQMSPAEVLAIELKQFKSGETFTLVPRILGQTTRSERAKPRKPRRTIPWTEDELLESIRTNCGAEQSRIAQDLILKCQQHGDISWGSGTSIGYCYLLCNSIKGSSHSPIAVMSNGKISINAWILKAYPILRDLFNEWIEKLNPLVDRCLPDADRIRHKEITLDLLKDEGIRNQFIDINIWLNNKLKEFDRDKN